MSACKRMARVVAAVSLCLLAVAAALWLLAVDAGLARRFAGFGGGGMLMALFLWFWPGNPRDSAPPALARRYHREFFPPMAAYVAVMLVWNRLLGAVESTGLRVLIALLPALPILLVMRAIARYVRDSDEMQRRIELESIAIAAGLVGMTYMTLAFLQIAGLIAVPATAAMLWVFPALCLFYGIIKLFIARRYA